MSKSQYLEERAVSYRSRDLIQHINMNWELDLTTRADGASVIPQVRAGGSSVWARVFDSSLVEETLPVEEPDFGATVWRWNRLDWAGGEAVPVPNADPVGYWGFGIEIDDRSFTSHSTSDYSSATAVEFVDGKIIERLTVQGELRKIVRLR